MDLALIDMSDLKSDCTFFVNKLDLITGKGPSLAELVETLRESHAQGLKLLQRNGQIQLKKRRLALKKAMQKEDLSKMSLERIRFYAKRLGVKNAKKGKKLELGEVLKKI